MSHDISTKMTLPQKCFVASVTSLAAERILKFHISHFKKSQEKTFQNGNSPLLDSKVENNNIRQRLYLLTVRAATARLLLGCVVVVLINSRDQLPLRGGTLEFGLLGILVYVYKLGKKKFRHKLWPQAGKIYWIMAFCLQNPTPLPLPALRPGWYHMLAVSHRQQVPRNFKTLGRSVKTFVFFIFWFWILLN